MSEQRRGPWTVRGTTEVFRNAFLRLAVDEVTQPDGRPSTYATVTVKPGVCVLAVGGDGTAHLVRQFRYAAGEESLEAVCGGRDEGETPEAAARRELREELGAEADALEPHGWVQLDGSVTDCRSHLFVARGLRFHETAREGTEPMAVVRLPLAEARAAVLDGRVRQAASAVLILRAALAAGVC